MSGLELATGILSRDDYLRAATRAIDFLRCADVRDILVAYGWGCDCPDEQLYQDMPMSLDRLQPFIAEAEAADFYRLGKDNLHVRDIAGRGEFLFCHESDIHFISDDPRLVDRLKAEWLAEGLSTMFVRAEPGVAWQSVNPAASAPDAAHESD